MMFINEIAKNYDAWYKKPLGAFVDLVETNTALKLYSPAQGLHILDAGCGTGNFSIKLCKMGCKVTGIDISEDMLAIARNKVRQGGLNAIFYKMDIYHLNFPDNYFDGIYSMAAFEFIHQPQEAYNELYRVLKPGGKLLIGAINRNSAWGKMYEKIGQQDPKSVFRNAALKTIDDFLRLDPDHLIATRGCVHIPPDASEESLTLEEEERLSQTSEPAFIIALWQKPENIYNIL